MANRQPIALSLFLPVGCLMIVVDVLSALSIIFLTSTVATGNEESRQDSGNLMDIVLSAPLVLVFGVIALGAVYAAIKMTSTISQRIFLAWITIWCLDGIFIALADDSRAYALEPYKSLTFGATTIVLMILAKRSYQFRTTPAHGAPHDR